jgi:uncharacterized membrane protein
MNNSIYLYLLIIILCWTFNPFIKKKIINSNKMNLDEYFVLNHFVVTIFLVVYFYTLFKENKCSINCLKKLDIYDYIYVILGAVTSILGARLMINVIKQQDISFLIAHIQPLIIALTFIIGYMFFSEHITPYKILGVSLIILGLIFINKKNKI